MSGGVRLNEDQYVDITGQLLEAQDIATAMRDAGHDIATRIQFVLDLLEQEHYPTVPEPDDLRDYKPGEPF